jgi:energy-coupling factor transport system ATP-binding protein
LLYSISNFSFKYPFSNNIININGSIDILAGDIVLINGRSGAGKSTLLYALKGLLPDTIFGTFTGDILFKGNSITKLSNTDKLKIGLIQQNPNSQIINSNVFDELAFGLENMMLDPLVIKEKILTMLERFNLTYLLDRDTNTLSGGEKQKIAFLSVILTNPEVILLDEPTAFLDPDSALSFMSLLHEIRHDKTIIIIEHNIHYVADIINRYFEISSSGVVEEQDLGKLSFIINQTQDYSCVRINLDKDTSLNKKNNNSLLLEVKNLSYSYGKLTKKVLNNINLSLFEQQILGVVGKSGAGKSTLLKILAGFIKTKDNVFINNIELNKLKTKQFYAQLGLLFQNPENHFLFSEVDEELNYNESMLKLFDLVKVRKQNPFTLSEGQKRRLSFGILKATFNRRIFLLDEPSFGQDYENRLVLIELINSMRNSGASFIIVSHDSKFLSILCDNIIQI